MVKPCLKKKRERKAHYTSILKRHLVLADPRCQPSQSPLELDFKISLGNTVRVCLLLTSTQFYQKKDSVIFRNYQELWSASQFAFCIIRQQNLRDKHRVPCSETEPVSMTCQLQKSPKGVLNPGCIIRHGHKELLPLCRPTMLLPTLPKSKLARQWQ